jgi:hypothetical protein
MTLLLILGEARASMIAKENTRKIVLLGNIVKLGLFVMGLEADPLVSNSGLINPTLIKWITKGLIPNETRQYKLEVAYLGRAHVLRLGFCMGTGIFGASLICIHYPSLNSLEDYTWDEACRPLADMILLCSPLEPLSFASFLLH